jgi:Family of unknown function (DUF5681)
MEISDVTGAGKPADTLPADPPAQSAWPEPVEPDDPPPPRGRPWAKGQSGNPAGRPPKRAHVAAWVANARINRKTLPLTDRMIELAWAGDRRLLQHLHAHITPRRHEPPIDLRLPPIETRADVCVAMRAVADAALNGTITSAQSLKLLRMLRELYFTL